MSESTGGPGGGPAVAYYVRLGVGGKDRAWDPYQLLRQVGSGSGAVEEVLGPDAEWHRSDVLGRVRRGELPGHLEEAEQFIVRNVVREYREEFEVQAGYLRRQAEGGFALRLAVAAHVARDDAGRPVPTEPLSIEDSEALVRYLTSAPLVNADYHTDGRWVWSSNLATLADGYRLPLEPEFAQHVRDRRYLLPPTIHPDVLRRAGALLETAASAPPGQRVREQSAPGQPPPATAEQRQRALSDWHQEWQERHSSSTPLRPERHPDDPDYNLHHVDVDAEDQAEVEYWRRADEIMGIDPRTGRRIDN